MYCTRPVSRSPSVYRVVSKPAANAARNASFFPSPFLARSPAAELAPLFRLLDDSANLFAPAYAHHARQTLNFPTPTAPATFNPRFDVREVEQSYELRGEVPGVESENLQVEFRDAQTLIIRGRAEREYSSQNTPTTQAVTEQPAVETETAPSAAEDNSDAASTYSTGSYQKPSVQDSDESGAAESSADAQARATATPAESTTSTSPPAAEATATAANPQPEQKQQQQQQQQQPHYWVSERSSGTFERVFKFPARVDQDAVRASLRNGILSIVVPKASPPVARRINVE